MISFILAISFVYLVWWMLSVQTRRAVFKAWTPTPNRSVPLVKAILAHQLRTLSAQNTVAQAIVDFSLKTKTVREMLMFICFQKITLLLIGLMILLSLEGAVFLGFLVVASIIMMVFFKKPVRILQVCFLAASFFVVFQFAFYKTSQWVFAPEQSELIFFLTDARLGTALALFVLSFVLTLILRFEHLSIIISALLFFSGALPITNTMMLILGEALAWCFYWLWISRKSKFLKTIFLEKLLLISVLSVVFMSALYMARGSGLLQVQVMGGVEDKKFLYVLVWAVWEISVSITLLVWGHFRARSKIMDESEVEVIQLPISIFKRNGWLYEQVVIRRRWMTERIQSLQGHLDSIPSSQSVSIPHALIQKSKLEVESLKSLLGALPSDSV